MTIYSYLPYQDSEKSALTKLKYFQFLFPAIILLAFFSQLVVAPFSYHGEQFFKYQFLTPISIGHFGFFELIFEILIAHNFIPRSETKRQSRISKNIVFINLGILKFFFIIYNGDLGPIGYIGIINVIGAFIQNLVLIVIFLLLDKVCEDIGIKYGGIGLYNAIVISTDLFWYLFSPIIIESENGEIFEGVLLAFFHLSIQRNPLYAWRNLWVRNNSEYNLHRLILIILIFCALIYLLSIKLVCRVREFKECKNKSEHYHTYKLISTGSMPFRLFNALHLSRSAIPYLKRSIDQYSMKTCLNVRKIPSNLDEMCYDNSIYIQAPVLRNSYSKSRDIRSISYYIIKVISCAVLHYIWFRLISKSPSYVHESSNVNGTESNVETIQIDNPQELKRFIRCLCIMNGFIVGCFAVIGDLIDFPLVSIIGLVNFVIHSVKFFDTHERPIYRRFSIIR